MSAREYLQDANGNADYKGVLKIKMAIAGSILTNIALKAEHEFGVTIARTMRYFRVERYRVGCDRRVELHAAICVQL